MLIQFSVKNFKTFNEKATITLVASNYDKRSHEEENIISNGKFNLRLLKSAVVYGAIPLLEEFDWLTKKEVWHENEE